MLKRTTVLCLVLLLSALPGLAQVFPSAGPFAGGEIIAPLILPDGRPDAPSLGFSSSPTTGLFYPGLNNIGFSNAGVNNFLMGGNGSFSLLNDNAAIVLGASGDVAFHRAAANVAHMKNGTNEQQFHVFNTDDGAGNTESFRVGWNGSNRGLLGTDLTGSGNARSWELIVGGVPEWQVGTNFFAPSDGVSRIGSTGFQVADLYLSNTIQGSNSTALTDATTTAFHQVDIPQTAGSNYAGGKVIFIIHCRTASNQAEQVGEVKFICRNVSGTEVCAFGTPDVLTANDGTAGLAIPIFSYTAGTNQVDLEVNSDCTGVTPTNHTIQHRLNMPQPNTATAQ